MARRRRRCGFLGEWRAVSADDALARAVAIVQSAFSGTVVIGEKLPTAAREKRATSAGVRPPGPNRTEPCVIDDDKALFRRRPAPRRHRGRRDLAPRRRSEPDEVMARTLQRLGTPAEVLARHGIIVRRCAARCPFHRDRAPSLSLFVGRDGRERWRCHACAIGGDAIDLEARLGGVSPGAVIRQVS